MRAMVIMDPSFYTYIERNGRLSLSDMNKHDNLCTGMMRIQVRKPVFTNDAAIGYDHGRRITWNSH
jgi:hypothetical protein